MKRKILGALALVVLGLFVGFVAGGYRTIMVERHVELEELSFLGTTCWSTSLFTVCPQLPQHVVWEEHRYYYKQP